MTSEMGEKAIDPAIIRCKKLSSGALIPVVGLGTFGSDSVSAARIANAVKCAIRIGYRCIDFASVYGNEVEIGRVLHEILISGFVRRRNGSDCFN